MDWDLAKVLNLLGITLEFLSFWFAAPEILGEERLRALERGLEKGVKLLPKAVTVPLLVAAGAGALLLTLVVTSVAEEPLAVVVPLLLVLLMLPMMARARVEVLNEMAPREVAIVLLLVVVPMMVVAVLMSPETPAVAVAVAMPVVLGVVGGVLTWVADKLQEKVVAPVLRALADDERIRQRSFAVGAVLFMIAFLCQFTAALLGISGP